MSRMAYEYANDCQSDTIKQARIDHGHSGNIKQGAMNEKMVERGKEGAVTSVTPI